MENSIVIELRRIKDGEIILADEEISPYLIEVHLPDLKIRVWEKSRRDFVILDPITNLWNDIVRYIVRIDMKGEKIVDTMNPIVIQYEIIKWTDDEIEEW